LKLLGEGTLKDYLYVLYCVYLSFHDILYFSKKLFIFYTYALITTFILLKLKTCKHQNYERAIRSRDEHVIKINHEGYFS